MPRNGSGTYSLPSGNPVAAGTLIDATWANNTLNDIANELTDSLSRSGEGGMLAPFRIADGLQATPGLAFTNEPSTGLYRAGSNDAWLVVGGTQVTQLTTNGMAGRFAAGAVTTPSITRLGDLNTGIYFPGADEFAIATGGVARMTFDSAGAVAIPGTLSVTGDVTVDTNTLFVDAANNRVGVGTVTPAVKLDVAGGVSIGSADNLTWGGAYGATTPAISGSAGFLAFYPNGSTSGEQMRLTATSLGLGTASPTFGTGTGVEIERAGIATLRLENSSASNSFELYVDSAANGVNLRGRDSSPMNFWTGNTSRMTLDSSGNLGLGVTPGAWAASRKAVQLGGSVGVFAGPGITQVSSNVVFDGTSKYIANGFAALYGMDSSEHRWYTAPSGTAGNAITFTQAMTLDASGNLLVGGTSQLYGSAGRGLIQVSGSSQALLGFGTTGNVGLGYLYHTGTNFELTNAQNGYLSFATNNTERARITSDGNFYVNTTGAGGKIYVVSDLTANNGLRVDTPASFTSNGIAVISATAAGTGWNFFYGESSGSSTRIEIRGDGNVYNANGTYGTISDARLKQDIVDAPSQWGDIKAIRFRKYRMKADVEADSNAPELLGVVAQELEQVCPGLVDGENVKTVKSSILLMKAAVALQEAMSRIEALEAKVAALEAGV